MSAALRATIEARLTTLRQDLGAGRAQLAHLQEVLPRIEGAAQVLEELLALAEPAALPESDTATVNPIVEVGG